MFNSNKLFSFCAFSVIAIGKRAQKVGELLFWASLQLL